MKRQLVTRSMLTISLIAVILFLILPITASAENVDNATFVRKLAEVKSRFKDGEYFAGNDGTGANLTYSSPTVLCDGHNIYNGVACQTAGYCNPPCTCKCGTYYYGGYARAWQCWGFACQVGYDIFGVDPYAHWETHRDVNNVKAGDIIRFSWSASYLPHSIFVTKVDGDTVYYGQSNINGPCKIQWNCSKSKGDLQALVNNRTDAEFCVYHAPNNTCTTGIVPLEQNPPTFSNLRVTSISSAGYTITLNVADDSGISRVAFPTWTEPNGQDDIINPWPIGTLSGNTVTYTVRSSDHGNQRNCRYYTHIYIYDIYDNYTVKDISIFVPATQGVRMETPSERVLPNGEYIIANAGVANKTALSYLAVNGSNTSWTFSETNVETGYSSNGSVPECDVWSVYYNSAEQFYVIKQKNTNMALTVNHPDASNEGGNVIVSEYLEADDQFWKISYVNGNGYLIQSRGSSFALDVAGGGDTAGTNVQQWTSNGSNAQAWLFIPYNVGPIVFEGRYILLYAPNESYELDVVGDTGNIANGTNVQIWNDSASSRYNSFDLIYVTDGFYKLKHVASGKCLDVTNGSSNFGANVALHDDNGSLAQQWGITLNNGGYSLVSRVNGYALDLDNGNTSNGANVQVYPKLNNDHQRWSFVAAEHTVHYDLNGGSGGPEDQIKYYNNSLTLSETVPSKAGSRFAGWIDQYNDGMTYSPGDVYMADEDLYLTAKWEQYHNVTISYNANGGTDAPSSQTFTGTAPVISIQLPIREGYDFMGWSTSPNAVQEEFHPGDNYSGDSTTLYAVWQIKWFTLSFNSDGAGYYDSVIRAYGETAGTLPEPSKTGVVFTGWFTSDGTKITSTTVIRSNLSLTAHWSAPTKIKLPDSITIIEDEAFNGVNTSVFVIPSSVTTIGSKAFANNSNLSSIIIYSRTVTPNTDAFYNSPNVTIYSYEDTPIHYYATAKNIPFIPLISSSGWVRYSDVPVGATITEEKWTYTETTYSTNSSMSGWSPSGSDWQVSDSGVSKFVNFPSGFNTGHALYTKYNPANRKTASETSTIKTVLGDVTNAGYVYWHWTLEDRWVSDAANAGKALNVYISDKYGLDSDGYTYTRFNAFEVNDILRPVYGTNTSNNDIDLSGDGIYSTCHHSEYNLPEYVSHWWWIAEIQQQPYTVYEKVYTFSRDRESTTEIQPGDGITNVQHWVKYSFD